MQTIFLLLALDFLAELDLLDDFALDLDEVFEAEMFIPVFDCKIFWCCIFEWIWESIPWWEPWETDKDWFVSLPERWETVNICLGF